MSPDLIKEILHWRGVDIPKHRYDKAFCLFVMDFGSTQEKISEDFLEVFLVQKHKKYFLIAKVENVIKQGPVSNNKLI